MKKMINIMELMKRVSKIATQLCLGAALFLGNPNAEAAQITWEGIYDNDLGFDLNWNPNTVPGNADTAIFSSAAVNLTPSADLKLLQFSAIDFVDSTSFNFGYVDSEQKLYGAGIINTGGASQTFTLSGTQFGFFNSSSADSSNSGTIAFNLSDSAFINFLDSSTASNSEISLDDGILSFYDQSSAASSSIGLENNSQLYFFDSSTAATSNISADLSTISFYDSTTAASAAITGTNNSFITFYDSSTADSSSLNASNGTSILFFDNSTADTSEIIVNSGGLSFSDQSTAASSTISATNGTSIAFNDNSTAASSSFNIEGSIMSFNDSSSAATSNINLANCSSLSFFDGSSAASATLSANQSNIIFSSPSVGDGTIGLSDDSSLIINESVTVGPITSDATSTITISSSALTIDSTVDSIIAGSISDDGDGSLVKIGPAKLSLNGVNTYQAGTTINAGNLAINNFTDGNVLINSGGTLSGIGTIGGNVNNDGTISPGNSIGTLTINGDYLQASTADYNVQTNSTGQSSLLDILGTASLDGTVVVTANSSFDIGNTYTILHADGGLNTTTFADAIVINPMILPFLSYDPLNVYLNLKQNIESAAITQNQFNVAVQLDSIVDPTNDELAILNSIISSPILSIAQDALDSLAGEQYTYLIEANQYADDRFGRRIYASVRNLLLPIDSCECECLGDFQSWVAFEGGRSFANGNKNASGFKATNWDANIGTHYAWDQFLVGIAGSYEHDRLSFNEGGFSSINTGQGAIYGAYKSENFYAYSSAIVSGSRAKMQRSIFVGIQLPERRSKSNFDMTYGDWYAEIGTDFTICSTIIQPFFAFDAGFFHRDHVKEKGALSANLEISKKSAKTFNTLLGAHLTGFYDCLTVGVDLAWKHRCNSTGHSISANFIDFGDTFKIIGNKQKRDGLTGAVIVSTPVWSNLEVFGEFSGEYWKNWSSYNFAGGINYTW